MQYLQNIWVTPLKKAGCQWRLGLTGIGIDIVCVAILLGLGMLLNVLVGIYAASFLSDDPLDHSAIMQYEGELNQGLFYFITATYGTILLIVLVIWATYMLSRAFLWHVFITKSYRNFSWKNALKRSWIDALVIGIVLAFVLFGQHIIQPQALPFIAAISLLPLLYYGMLVRAEQKLIPEKFWVLIPHGILMLLGLAVILIIPFGPAWYVKGILLAAVITYFRLVVLVTPLPDEE